MKKEILYISGIIYGSLVDGPGLRTIIFFSGCNRKSKNCYNEKFHKKESGKTITVIDLIETIKNKTPQKKITISGVNL